MFTFFRTTPIEKKLKISIFESTRKYIQKKIDFYKETTHYAIVTHNASNNQNNHTHLVLFLLFSLYGVLHSIIKKKCFLK
jgi:hypothetical protein